MVLSWNDGVDWDALHDVHQRRRHERSPPRRVDDHHADRQELFCGRAARPSAKGSRSAMALVLGKAWSKARTSKFTSTSPNGATASTAFEAAAQRYFHKKASQLDARELALLATSLPNPIKRNSARPSPIQRILAAASSPAPATPPNSWIACRNRGAANAARQRCGDISTNRPAEAASQKVTRLFLARAGLDPALVPRP